MKPGKTRFLNQKLAKRMSRRADLQRVKLKAAARAGKGRTRGPGQNGR
jgi:hypothetical protein